ncbi:YlbD family protein [Bacillus sp. CHD6a]|uniref:YlbD family protein n=1 Tax=Bacillus sp. CHD6a TaxID=1643452 RepID=UPI0006CCA14F|nr:YlbD family protein [Bacillus sp. CHD6a]KPB03338.1 cytosolic protein [Bacillus sp. CHD6a]
MATNQKHPSIEKFKDFVKRHPKLSQEVKSKKKTWQDLFEEWYLLGEEDESWKNFRDDETQEEKTEKKSDVIPLLLQSLKKMDVNQMQYHLTNVNSAIGNIQELIQQFIPNSTKGSSSPTQGVKNPFSFRKD